MSAQDTPPYTYQQRVLSNLSDRKSMGILPYGSGKSRIGAQGAVEHIQSDHNQTDFRVVGIVFCRPRNIGTWQREWMKWYPQVRTFTMETLQELELCLQNDAVDGTFTPTVLLVPHHQMRTQFELLLRFIRTWRPASLIMDESTRIKYPKTKMTECALQLSEVAPPDCRRMAFTGNATPESPENIWSQFAFCYPKSNPFGSSFYSFLRRFFLKGDYGYALRLDKQAEFDSIVTRYCHTFSEIDHKELREVIGNIKVQYVVEQYEESAEQRRILDHLYATWSLPGDIVGADADDGSAEGFAENDLNIAGTAEYSHTMSILQKAQQLASGFYYGVDGEPVYLRHNPKLALCVQIIQDLLAEAPDRGIVLWQRYKAERQPIALALQGAGISHTFGPDEQALRAFMGGEGLGSRPSVIVMPAGVTEGFNELVRANVNLIFSQNYSQEMRGQLEARLNRIGQTSILVTHIDLASERLADMEVVVALQTKSFTPERAATIVRKYSSKELKDVVQRNQGS